MYDIIFDTKLTITEAKYLLNLFSEKSYCEVLLGQGPYLGNSKLYKKIFQECQPSISLAAHLSVSHLEFISIEANRYDCIFHLNNDEFVEVECVTAMDQREHAVKKEHMELFHHRAPVFQKILRSEGSQHKRILGQTDTISLQPGMIVRSLFETINERVSEVFQNKTDKQKNGKVYQNTILLIFVEDSLCIDDLTESYQLLLQTATTLQNKEHQFKGVYLVGTSGNVVTVFPYLKTEIEA